MVSKRAYPKIKKSTFGFTIVEIIVVVAVVGIILPTLFAIIFTLIRLQIQISELQRLKEVGDYVSTQITNTVRNYGSDISTTECRSTFPPELLGTGDSVMFKDREGNCFGYYFIDNKLASISANLTEPVYLVNSTDTDYPVSIDEENSLIEALNDKLVKIKFIIRTNPKTDYLPVQTLRYQFFMYLRN